MQPTEPLVLEGGTLIDVRTGERSPDSVVIVDEGRITGAGRRGDVPIPPGYRRENVSGGWLIPGLVDMHVHLSFHPLHLRLLPLYPAHGVTTVRDVGGRLTVLSLLRQAMAADRRPGPRIFFVGPILDGIPPLWPNESVLVDGVNRARTAVRMLVAQGVDGIKVYNSVPEASLAAIVEEAHAAGLPVLGHVPRSISTSRAIELGMDCLEHIRVTGREFLPIEEADEIDYLPLGVRETLLWERFDLESEGMARLIQRLVESRVFLDPTLIIDAYTSLGHVEDPWATALEEELPDATRIALREHDWTDELRRPDDMAERARRGFEKRLAFIGLCNRAGVRLVAGTDTFGPGGLLPGAGLLNELGFLVQAGLTPLEALRAATVIAAEALGQQDEIGTLEAGKRADIVVLDADPTVDIHNTRRVRLVLCGGEIFTPGDLIARALPETAPVG